MRSLCIAHEALGGSDDSADKVLIWAKVSCDIVDDNDGLPDLQIALKVIHTRWKRFGDSFILLDTSVSPLGLLNIQSSCLCS